MKIKIQIPALILLFITGVSCGTSGPVASGISQNSQSKLYTINTRRPKDVKSFFRYTPDRLPFVSAHRGGPREGFPENCIATFENTLSYTPAILEIDPHYTKDGQIILMHDATLDRTSNGTGKIIDYTLEELKRLRLKDTKGKLTDYQIPTLDEALQWAKGKTILVIDMKDVPIEARVKKIMENDAEGNAIVISYSMDDTKKSYALNRNIVMEVMMGKVENVDIMDKSGIPWENVVGFVSHELPKDNKIFEELHKRGTMAMQGSSRNYDIQFMRGRIKEEELHNGYRSLIEKGADIIEADLGIEAGAALKPLQQAPSAKSKYFK
jgi:glycerophosphoryl diester phosphodiesterase